MTIFPKLDLVFFQFENVAEVTKSLGITFEFMKNNQTPIRMILVKVEKDNEMKEEVNKYRNKFQTIGFNLRTRNIDENFVKDFAKDIGIDIGDSEKLFSTMELIDNAAKLIGKSEKFVEHSMVGKIQDFTNKHIKLVQGLIVEIKKMKR
eukprot:UN13391